VAYKKIPNPFDKKRDFRTMPYGSQFLESLTYLSLIINKENILEAWG